MSRALLLSVRFHDGRYHGVGDWPPSPARLFQALVAGAARGQTLVKADREALAWLESLEAPIIAAPTIRVGQGFKNYVPNNDLDAVGGDPGRVSEIRAPKFIRPRLFDDGDMLLYAWTFEEGDEGAFHAQIICTLAERLYQLGRGVDMAWAWAKVLDGKEIELRLAGHPGVLYRPALGGAGAALLCPQKGSLVSLEGRFQVNQERFTKQGTGKKARQLFSQAPKPSFAAIAYDSPPQRCLFDLRRTLPDAPFAPWPYTRTVQLVEALRDAVAERLKHALPQRDAMIERILIGRGATEADKAARVRIVPLPSVGTPNTDPSIRRVLVEIPPNCPVPVPDIAWGFSAIAPFDAHDTATGEVLLEGPRLTPSSDQDMLQHYGIEEPDGARLWRTLTPAALPQSAARRRIDPGRLRERIEQKGAAECAHEQSRAADAALQALRHAGIAMKVEAIRAQREPFERKGERAEVFAVATRFRKEQLWHIEITFAEPVHGPLVIGDGRYLGLGLMAPVNDAWRDVMVFALPPEPKIAVADRAAMLRAVRRALMALSRNSRGDVPRIFSGHEADGAPARSGQHEHVFLAGADLDGDGGVERLIVAAPWVCDRSFRSRPHDRAVFHRVVSSLAMVRAGKLGVIVFGSPAALLTGDPLMGPAHVWESCTLYRPTRHAGKGEDPAAAVVYDAVAECQRRQLPRPEIELLELNAGPNGGGVEARLRLRFAVAIEGPIMLGRDSHAGGGLFETLRRKDK
jgi:CRISPR-associated protein Csb2